jgi:hypothetical protein
MPMTPHPVECRLRASGEIVSEAQFRLSFPNVSFPAVLTDAAINAFGADLVQPSAAPQTTMYQSAERNGVGQVNGQWVWAWTVRDWSAEEIAAYEAAKIPQTVTRRQAKQALLLAGLLDNVQPAIDAMPDATQRRLMQLEWDESLEFVRTRPSHIAMGTAIGLDAAGIDALFIQAVAL